MDYDSNTLQLLFRVFDTMWRGMDTSSMPQTERAASKVRLKQRLLEAAEAGESAQRSCV
jgi:hypothetical protein